MQKEDNNITYTANGKPLAEKSYKTHINKISESVAHGAETYTSGEVRKYVLNMNK